MQIVKQVNSMHNKNILVWIFAILFLSVMITISTIELVRSHKMRIQLVYTEADLSGYLVSEWIQKSLDNVRAVLKDSLYDIDHSNIMASSIDEKERTVRNKILVHKFIRQTNTMI